MVERLKIYSYGHSGTTYLTQMLPGVARRHLQAKSISGLIDHNCNTRLLDPQTPHAPYFAQPWGDLGQDHPLAAVRDQYPDKAIVLYSDPRNALLSLFSKSSKRAGVHLAHMHYKGPPTTWNPIDIVQLRALGLGERHPEFIVVDHLGMPVLDRLIKTREPALLQYKEFKGFDIFFNSWLTSDTSFDIAFIKYEWLPRIADDLAAFINLPLEHRKPWCEHIKATFTLRSSDWTQLDEANQQVLSTMFASLLEIQQSLPPFWIKKGSSERIYKTRAPKQWGGIK